MWWKKLRQDTEFKASLGYNQSQFQKEKNRMKINRKETKVYSCVSAA
jgi:hypothetical protein